MEPVLRNGRITTAERYLGEELHGYAWRGFDPVSETALLLLHADDGHGPMDGLAVLGPTGPVATLTCGRVLRCGPAGDLGSSVATLGPEADEVTVAAGDRTAKVIGHDGTLRETMDLTPTVTPSGHVRGLRWSPDGSRLAVLTEQDAPGASEVAWRATRVWVVDREGDHAQLAFTFLATGHGSDTSDAPDFDGRGIIWVGGGWNWSPDGQSLLLDVLTGGPDGTADNPAVVVLRLPPHGAVHPVDAQTLYRSDRVFDWWGNVAWSPDGARIAVRTRHHITEISAADGSVIKQHPHRNGWIIWPAREGLRR
ncbi:MAG TPA: hypothetical protein VFK52_11895 [Nocardioidaceae bacterium]|nr:hypothetical protein [Nocardioidaceae bacterium]